MLESKRAGNEAQNQSDCIRDPWGKASGIEQQKLDFIDFLWKVFKFRKTNPRHAEAKSPSGSFQGNVA